LCSEGGEQSADSSSVVSFKIEEDEIQIKEEEEPIALLSTIKDEPEVSPQIFHQYIGLLSVILPFSLLPLLKSTDCVKWKWSVYM
jgi:hypothetical protein